VVLSANTGALEWSQQLAVVEPNLTQDSFRRNAGATPSFADGVLVCPTSAGAIVGIDLTTRSLLWGYQYPRLPQGGIDRFNAVRFGMYPGAERRTNEHWADACVTIADGRALVTPVESDQLYCLNLVDGKELWKQSRANHLNIGYLYVGCVHRGSVILIGHNTVSALKLADGDKAWPDIELPAGSMPGGRGFYAADAYYLPLTSAEVAKINLKTGRIEERARSRSGNIPGNLICYGGSIISQGADYLDAYFQLDALKQRIAKTLESHPEDPKALAALGEVKLDEGALGEAIDLFRRSYSLKRDETTREQLVESLLEGLRVDFAAHRGRLTELDGLIEQKQHRLTYWRVMALGLQKAGEISPAFEAYLQLADADASAGLDAIDASLGVRRDRWIRVQLEQLRAVASPAQQRQIDAAVTARLTAAMAAESSDALRTFVAVFGGHPAAERARDALVARLGDNDLLEREMLLRNLERSTSESTAAAAEARLAQLMQQAGRHELAAIHYRQLAQRFAQVVCQDGKTGQQVVAELAPESPIRELLKGTRAWPLGKVVSKEEKATTRNNPPPRLPRAMDLEIVGPTGPYFDDMTISFDAQGPVLVGQDGLGEKRFRILLNEQGRRPIPTNNRYNGYNLPALYPVSVNGSLLVLSMGNQVVAVDTLAGAESSSNRVLWTQDLNDQIPGLPTNQGVHSQPVPLLWGGSRNVPTDPYSRRLGSIGPVTEDGIYFQRLRDLYCVDPLSGKTLWSRKNVGLGNDLFGDQELLFVAPAGEGDTIVLRAATGEMLGTRRVVSFEKRMATIGRLVLSWEPQGAEQVMQLRDAWEGRTLWSYAFKPGAKADLVLQEAVGVLEPNGDFSLIALPDGKLLAKERLEPEKALVGIYLLRSRDQYLLVTQTPARNEPGVTINQLPVAANSPLINGHLYAFERSTGKKMWPAPAVIAQHGLLLSQPSQVPVLVFARQVNRPGPPNARDPKTSVLCIDKRTGRVVYENEQVQGSTIGNFELSGDPNARTVSLSVASKLITLTFTDDPVDPIEPEVSKEIGPTNGRPGK
jgi:outer membrane protein assembly factor BamB